MLYNNIIQRPDRLIPCLNSFATLIDSVREVPVSLRSWSVTGRNAVNKASLITAANVCLHYGDDVVLHDIDFSIQSREIVTILGPNGSGKSSLLRLLIGALQPTAGQVSHRDDLRIGYVPQRLSVDTNLPMSVERFLRLGTRATSFQRKKWIEQIDIKRLLPMQVSQLSGGQLQRVMLAHALLDDPNILILDEATQGLDQQGEASFYRLIEQVRAEQACAVLLVSHDLHVVMSASDRVVCLNGHVCCEGAPTIVSAAPEYRALFGLGTEGALALYRHDHDHTHPHNHGHSHAEDHSQCAHSEQQADD